MSPAHPSAPTTDEPNSPVKAPRRSRWNQGPDRIAEKRANRSDHRQFLKGKIERRNRWDKGPDRGNGGFGAASQNTPDPSNEVKMAEEPESKTKKALKDTSKTIATNEEVLAERSEIPTITSTSSVPEEDNMKQEGVAETFPCGCMLMVEPIEDENPDFDIDIYGDDETRDYCRRLKRCRSHGF